ncbi:MULTISPECIES: hypothetical protein [unclassified Streptomyces]|uniref:hypothetical protein n=1 Tax=unclassified Streptomyces TaxID=2593676 RepID=UPI0028C4A332|nr:MULTISPECIES: hypothetical protein [unclassified Streptomyces]WNO70810.1 hypothetical protein RPQ07_03870 [Streptomyces sp. AM8-1-1]
MSTQQDQARTASEPASEMPSPAEKAGWTAARQRAAGMTHHEAKAALEAAQHAAKRDAFDDAADAVRVHAEIEEWERIVEALADHAGAYDPVADPFVQGELAGEQDHRSAR